jgi:hypothetical protein
MREARRTVQIAHRGEDSRRNDAKMERHHFTFCQAEAKPAGIIETAAIRKPEKDD